MKIFLIELRNASFRVKIYYLWALCLFIAVPMLYVMYYLLLAFDWIKKMRNKI